MGSCSTKIKLSDDDKKALEICINDNSEFAFRVVDAKHKTTSKKDLKYLDTLVNQHLESNAFVYSKK